MDIRHKAGGFSSLWLFKVFPFICEGIDLEDIINGSIQILYIIFDGTDTFAPIF